MFLLPSPTFNRILLLWPFKLPYPCYIHSCLNGMWKTILILINELNRSLNKITYQRRSEGLLLLSVQLESSGRPVLDPRSFLEGQEKMEKRINTEEEVLWTIRHHHRHGTNLELSAPVVKSRRQPVGGCLIWSELCLN